MSLSLFPGSLYSDPVYNNPLYRFFDEVSNYNKRSDTGGGSISHFQPKFDIVEHSNEYELHGELPGLDKKDLHVEFTDAQTILMRGRVERSYSSGTPPKEFAEGTETRGTSRREKGKEGEKDEGPKYWVAERSIGEFQRTFVFGHKVDQDKVSAELKDGILTMHVPKADSTKGRLVEVK
jgi:HSP20 family molecular chaperone IbpA